MLEVQVVVVMNLKIINSKDESTGNKWLLFSLHKEEKGLLCKQKIVRNYRKQLILQLKTRLEVKYNQQNNIQKFKIKIHKQKQIFKSKQFDDIKRNFSNVAYNYCKNVINKIEND